MAQDRLKLNTAKYITDQFGQFSMSSSAGFTELTLTQIRKNLSQFSFSHRLSFSDENAAEVSLNSVFHSL